MSRDWPDEVLEKFGSVCMSVLEPLSPDRNGWPDYAVNEKGEYRWKQSDLPSRVARQAARSAISRYFKVPPSEAPLAASLAAAASSRTNRRP